MTRLRWDERLKRARERRGLTQKQLAAAVGVSERHIIRIENGKPASRKLSMKLADRLGDPRLVLPLRPHRPASGLEALATTVERLIAAEEANQRRLDDLERRLGEFESGKRGRGRS